MKCRLSLAIQHRAHVLAGELEEARIAGKDLEVERLFEMDVELPFAPQLGYHLKWGDNHFMGGVIESAQLDLRTQELTIELKKQWWGGWHVDVFTKLMEDAGWQLTNRKYWGKGWEA